jgi:hypothetical protein
MTIQNYKQQNTLADHRHELSSPARTLGLCVQILLKAWMSVCVYSVCVVCR